MINKKNFRDEVLAIKSLIKAVIPAGDGITFAAIIVALAELIKELQEQQLFSE